MIGFQGMIRRSIVGFAALSTIFTANVAWAFPLTSQQPWRGQDVRVYFDRGFDVDGIVGMPNCSASFVRFKGQSEDMPGLVMSNGHCMGGMFGGMIKPGQVLYRQARSFNMNLLDRAGKRIGSLRSEKIIYATMTDTDVALLELTQTYRQIKAATGVSPLELSNVMPAPGTPIQVSSGYWNRTYRCQIEAIVPGLREGNWTFRHSLRYSETGCEVVGGTSGSPILSAVTGEVIAINNTGNESGQRCTVNNPCEVAADGTVTVIPGRGYGQQTYWLYSCLTPQGEFDLAVPGCVLPKGGNWARR